MLLSTIYNITLHQEQAVRMCIICVEFEMSRLTIKEARRNLSEMAESLDPEHVEEIEKALDEKELEQMDDEEFREEYDDMIADGSD